MLRTTTASLAAILLGGLLIDPAAAKLVVEVPSPTVLDRDAEAELSFLMKRADQSDGGEIRVIVGLRTDLEKHPEADRARLIESAAAGLIQEAQGTLREKLQRSTSYSHLPLLAIELNSRELTEVVRLPHVLWIEEESTTGRFQLNDATELIGASEARSQGVTGSGWVIAIIDSGIKKDATGLSGKVVSEGCFSTPYPGRGSACYGGAANGSTAADSGRESRTAAEAHGTSVAGAAVANSPAGYGVAPDASLISLNVASWESSAGPGYSILESDVLAALNRVYQLRSTYDIAAVNMSFLITPFGSYAGTCDSDYPGLSSAVGLLGSAGIAVVAASGNLASNNMGAPGCLSDVISVAGVTKDDQIWMSSNISAQTKLLAVSGSGASHSTQLYTTGLAGYTYSHGTSLAAPQVAGAMALLKAKTPHAAPSEMLDQLASTGVPKSRGAFVVPRIDVEAAIETPSMPQSLTITRDLCFGQNSASWSASSGPVTKYVLEGSASPTFTATEVYYSGSSTSAIFNVTGTTYLRVRACNGLVCSTNKGGNVTAIYFAGCM